MKKRIPESDKLLPVGSKVPQEEYDRLRWLAYMNETTVSSIIAGYISKGMEGEDFTQYQPPKGKDNALQRVFPWRKA